jgi:hypothetical protein
MPGFGLDDNGKNFIANMTLRAEMAKGLTSPHLLLASSNPMKMIQNLNHLLEEPELYKLTAELDRNVVALFHLGETHFIFASRLNNHDWRQKISRLYYAVYNVRRAITLKSSGSFSTESSDHQNNGQIPDSLSNKNSHVNNIRTLRDDRNLADYSHLAQIDDLVMEPDDALSFATQFIADCRRFLIDASVPL